MDILSFMNKNSGKSKGKTSSTVKKIPKTVQQSIPYVRVYADENTKGGIIETEDGVFTKSYLISDTNYSDVGEDRQEEILEVFEKILKTFSPDYNYQITINNRTVDPDEFNKRILMQYRADGLDDLRQEFNGLIMEKMQEGKNNLRPEKYLTVSVPADNVREAINRFQVIEKGVNSKIKQINNVGIEAISLKDRLEILHDIYNNGAEGDFKKYFDLDMIRAQGKSTKDIVGPSMFDFTKKDYFMIDDRYVRVLSLNNTPASLVSTLPELVSSIAANTIVSIHYEKQNQAKATAFASALVTNVGGEVVKAQKELSKSGASADLISPTKAAALANAKELYASLTEGDQSLFHVTVAVAVLADSLEDLNVYSEQIKNKGLEISCRFDILRGQQEQAFNSCIPLGINNIHEHSVLTTYQASAIQPFSTLELQIKGGFFYGLNQQSKNLIIYNKGISNNQNSVILGSPGTGKSFFCKWEMLQVYLNTTNSQIFIVDPEREYSALAKALGGEVFYIEPNSEFSQKDEKDMVYLNPFDLDITPDNEGDPFGDKVNYIISLIETMLGGHTELNGRMKAIVDSTLQELYGPYIASLYNRGITIDREACPTFEDFYHELKLRKEAEARNLADNIKMYCIGSQNLFAHHTNVNPNAKMVVFDINNIGTNLLGIGMQVCLNHIWNSTLSNVKKGMRTYSYFDEFHLLLKHTSSADYCSMIWKRIRKFGGSPVAITQQVSDLVNCKQGMDVLETSDFALMLGQKFNERMHLARIFHISDEQLEYITNTGKGEGLIYTSRAIVPFENIIDEDSDIYKLISTKPKDAENLDKDHAIA